MQFKNRLDGDLYANMEPFSWQKKTDMTENTGTSEPAAATARSTEPAIAENEAEVTTDHENAVINPAQADQQKIVRTAYANWQGDLKSGKGTLGTESQVLTETNYSYKTRFEEGEIGTNPEELLAAAHAGCFTMSVSAILTKRGLNPTSLNTTATVSMLGLAITGIHLSITGIVADITVDEFAAVVEEAEKTCLISKILNLPVTSESHFIS